jgi:sugar phosphate isomerase/epimerase
MRFPDPHPLISLNGAYDPIVPLTADVQVCIDAGVGWLGIPRYKFDQLGAPEAIAFLRSSPIAVSTVCHPSLATLDDRSQWPREVDAARRTLQIAADIQARSVYLTTGNRGSLSWAKAADAFADAVSELREYADSLGMPLLVEPTSPSIADLSIVHTLADLLSVCAKSGLGVCLDVFACWADSTFGSMLEAAAHQCGLVQVADYAGGDRNVLDRAVPGDGMIDYAPVFAALRQASYGGLFDLELRGKHLTAEGIVPAFRRAAAWAAEQLALAGFPLP